VQGDATYLIVNNDGALVNYGLNAVCTHLGCVVPWNKARARRLNALDRLVGFAAHALTLPSLTAGREQVQVPVPRLAVQRRGQGHPRPRPAGASLPAGTVQRIRQR